MYEVIGTNWIGISGLATKCKHLFGEIKKKSVLQQLNRYCLALVELRLIEQREVPGANKVTRREFRRLS